MYVLSISSVSEVLMVHTQKNLPTKNILQTKKEMETFIFLFKKKSKVNKPKKSISSTSRQLLNLPLFVCLSLFPTINQYLLLSLSLYSYSSLSLSLSLFALALHTICVTFVHISFRFSSQKKIKQSLRWNFISFHSWFSSFFLEQSKLQDYKCIYSHYTIYTYI